MKDQCTAENEVLSTIPVGLYIDGRWDEAEGGSRFGVEDPSTARILLEVADGAASDGRRAIDAAVSAQDAWARTAPRERGEILRRSFEAVISQSEKFALLMTLEMGKPLAEAHAEVAYGAEFLRWFSEEAVRAKGRYMVAPDGRSRLLVMKKPVGPCLLITPWNFPLAMATRKIAPAIAAGCTMVVKPSNLTPLTTSLLITVLEQAGLPPGVVNVVNTTDPGALVAPMLRDGGLRKLSFTGSTPVGVALMKQAAETVMRSSMELGGNAPFLVFEDADLAEAVDAAMLAKFRNTGQACTAANRFLVHEKVADEFAHRLAERVATLVVGRGTDPATDIGPLINQASRDKVTRLVRDAVDSGADLLTGGTPAEGAGYFYTPTVLASVTSDSPILRHEVFGPVAPVVRFSNEREATAMANASQYGLATYVFTQSIDRGLRLAESLECGMVGLNTGLVSNAAAPFGGVKQSGLGREGGTEGIEEYLETQYIGLADPHRSV